MKELKLLKLKPKSIDLKKFKHKKRVAILVIIALLGSGAAYAAFRPRQTMVSDYMELTRDDMVKSVSAMGNVKSEDKTNVYSTLNNVVKVVNVEVGDKVNAGDVLCVLDSSDLEREISESSQSIAVDKERTRLDVESKRQEYENKAYLYNNNLNASINNSQKALDQAKIKLDDAQNDYDRKKTLFENNAGTKTDLEAAESNLNQCRSDYENAITDLEHAKVTAKQELDTARNQYESALNDHNNNKEEITLQGKKDNVGKCVITAPVSGTITAVNTSVGSPAQGVLFTIENLDDPVIVVNVKEVDINKVAVGQEVEVTTDATPDEEFSLGTIYSVSDTTNTGENVVPNGSGSNNGNSSSSSNTFEAKIKLDNPLANDYIKVGMSAKANIILEKKSSVFSISFTSIIEDEDGKFIEVLKENGEGLYEVRKIPVTTGLESDVSVEIQSDELEDGDKVILNPSFYQEGQIVGLMPQMGGDVNE